MSPSEETRVAGTLEHAAREALAALARGLDDPELARCAEVALELADLIRLADAQQEGS